jgi:hypothetical protein
MRIWQTADYLPQPGEIFQFDGNRRELFQLVNNTPNPHNAIRKPDTEVLTHGELHDKVTAYSIEFSVSSSALPRIENSSVGQYQLHLIVGCKRLRHDPWSCSS